MTFDCLVAWSTLSSAYFWDLATFVLTTTTTTTIEPITLPLAHACGVITIVISGCVVNQRIFLHEVLVSFSVSFICLSVVFLYVCIMYVCMYVGIKIAKSISRVSYTCMCDHICRERWKSRYKTMFWITTNQVPANLVTIVCFLPTLIVLAPTWYLCMHTDNRLCDNVI